MPKSISDVKAYWDASPCFTKRSSAPRDSKQFMDETEARKFKSEPKIPEFAEYGKWENQWIWEIGPGIGIDSVNFARAGATVTATDLSANSLLIAQKRAELAGVNVKFIEADAEHLPGWVHNGKPIPTFDLVYAFGSIHHSPNPEKIIANARYFLKPGGTLKIMVYNKYSWKALWILLKYGRGQFWKFSELIARHSEARTGCPITHVYSRRSARKLVEDAGFKVKKISVDHIFKFEIEDYKNYKYTVARPWRWLPESWFRALEKRIGWHLLIEATC